MASDEKPRLRPCPAYRQFVSALNSIGGAVLQQSAEPWELHPGVSADPERMLNAHAELCALLLALLNCSEFWKRLWFDNLKSALQLIDLGDLEAELQGDTITHLIRFFEEMGMSEQAAEAYVEEQVRECLHLADQIAIQYRGRPNSAVLFQLKNKALFQVRRMSETVCGPLNSYATKVEADRRARRLLTWVRRLFGSMITGALGAAHPTLIMDNPDGPAYLALTGDARNRALLTAISILTLHASETPGPEPLVNAQPVPVPA